MNIDISQINRKSWELSMKAMRVKGKKGKFECAISGKLREIYDATQSENFKVKIKEIVDNYNPPQDMEVDRKKVLKEFGDNLITEINNKGMSQRDTKQLMQYVLWNTAILEKIGGKIDEAYKKVLGLYLDAEGITETDKKILEKKLEKLVSDWEEKKKQKKSYSKKSKKGRHKGRYDRSEYPGYKGG